MILTQNKTHPVVVFDIGNVLVRWNPYDIYRNYLGDDPTAVDQFLKEINFHEWNLEMDRGRPFSEVIPEVCNRYPQQAELIRVYDEHYEESLMLMQPTVDILLDLKKAGRELYALSNWSAERFIPFRQKHVFFNCFKAIVISGEVGMIKPEPGIYELLLEKVQRPAGECLFIDDSPDNINAAVSLGFQTIRFMSPELLRKELEKRELFNA